MSATVLTNANVITSDAEGTLATAVANRRVAGAVVSAGLFQVDPRRYEG